MTSPDADPAGPAAPYTGPPVSGPPPFPAPSGPPGHGPAPYGPPPQYGSAPYGPPPQYGSAQYGSAPYGPPLSGPPGYPPAPGVVPGLPPGVVPIPGRPPLRAASPSARILGRLLDSIGYAVLLAVAIIGIIAVVRHELDTIDYSYGFPSGILWIYPIGGAVWLLIAAYEWLTIGLFGATLGDRVMGVRFVDPRDGSRPGLGRSAARTAMLAGGVVFCYGLPFLLLLASMFFDNQPGRYQSWVDKASGLQAVTTRD